MTLAQGLGGGWRNSLYKISREPSSSRVLGYSSVTTKLREVVGISGPDSRYMHLYCEADFIFNEVFIIIVG
jgi:hypothetical protein